MPLPISRRAPRRAFTVIELLVVVSIIALLVGILLPAIGAARDRARQTQSLANLRQLGVAHANYAAEWNDRQFTLVHDSISTYGNGTNAFVAYRDANGGGTGGEHPPAILGWGYDYNAADGDAYVLYQFRCDGNAGNAALTLPIAFTGSGRHFGSFRLVNVRQFNQYVSGRFHDPTFYAPKDRIVLDDIDHGSASGSSCFDDPGEYCSRPAVPGVGALPHWSSYVMSPAAMFNPRIMRAPDENGTPGFLDPWQTASGFRSPAMGQARYPSLKTHMLEHHWLQNRRAECNPTFAPGSYSGCEPYYFNHAFESTPMTLFYDGHVAPVGTREAMRADGRQFAQTGDVSGLWHRGTPFGPTGYFTTASYDQDAETSYHILTTDGILGRDVTSNGQ